MRNYKSLVHVLGVAVAISMFALPQACTIQHPAELTPDANATLTMQPAVRSILSINSVSFSPQRVTQDGGDVELVVTGTPGAHAESRLVDGDRERRYSLTWDTGRNAYTARFPVTSEFLPGNYTVSAVLTTPTDSTDSRAANDRLMVVEKPQVVPLPALPSDLKTWIEAQRVYFPTASPDVSSVGEATIKQIADKLREYRTYLGGVVVEGHCDARGSEDLNFDLGLARANAVADKLVAQQTGVGVSDRLSLGKANPDPTGTGESNWSKNRWARIRVDVIAKP